jgi:hypothetical protein
MASQTFRKLPKVSLEARIPDRIVKELGRKAIDEGKIYNQVVSEVLCVGLGIDPKQFGIEPKAKPRVGAN